MASERWTKIADALTDALCGGKLSCTDHIRMADWLDAHFPVPPPGREAEAAEREIVSLISAVRLDSSAYIQPIAPIIASAYADRLAKYEAVAKAGERMWMIPASDTTLRASARLDFNIAIVALREGKA